MSQPGLWIETLENPVRYTDAQIDRAVRIAEQINRGKFLLCEPPRRGQT